MRAKRIALNFGCMMTK